MALTVEQITAVSFPAVLSEMRKAHNQWHESSALRAFEKMGFIQRVSFGENIEVPLDYRPNPDIAVLANDQDTASLINTEIVTSAVYDIAQISQPVTWTKAEEVKNPTDAQKISLSRQKLENGINSHDDLVEQLIFTSSTAGGVEVNGLDVLVPTSGLGSPGGISATTETFWRNFADTYTDSSDIEAAMTEAFHECMKGSGSALTPKLLLSGQEPYTMFESGLQALQHFNDTSEADAGFTSLKFKNSSYVFSQYGGTNIYFLNPKAYSLVFSKQYFRDKGETNQIDGQNAWYFLIYSAMQAIVSNKSRLAVLSQA